MTMTIMTLALEESVAHDIARRVPGSNILETTEIAKSNVGLPLDSRRAEDRMDRDGNITVTLLLDQEKYFDHVIAAASDGANSPEDYAHDVAFGFGAPRESSSRIIGVSGTEFIVSYTTHIRECLDD
ncbi:hypothetical protein ACVWY0_001056 [Arthrobacter sp. UYNi723]